MQWRIRRATRCTPSPRTDINRASLVHLRPPWPQPKLEMKLEVEAMDEFQEADILWPDAALPPQDELLLAPSEPYEPCTASSCTPLFARRLDAAGFFLRGGPSSSAGTGLVSDDDEEEEEWQEADVLWLDTVDERRGGGALGAWPFRGGFGCAGGRHVKPAAAARRQGWRTTSPAVSSPIDIPDNVAARRRLAPAMNRRL
ncbi:hypothetical protein ACP70R_036793 [Stipagrostis hirtigluma subsp. patula]